MSDNGQRRARAGGEVGVNGDFYEGGKFLPATEDRPKTAPVRHEVSVEEQARRDARNAEQEARAERIRVWLEARRIEFGGIIATLTRKPADSPATPERWAQMVTDHAAGFLPSLGQSLRATGCVSPRQAEAIAKAIHGRRTKQNAFGFDGLVDNLTRDIDAQ